MARPVIALLTDFGTRDHYTGTMKGVALGICADITFVDITHDIPPQDVAAGALELAAAYPYFPAGTIFLVVIDPGVGSRRRAIAAEAGDYRFVAPDNGVLTLVFQGTPPKRVVEVTEPRYARPTVSRTFEGRDRFAPAAAWLATGLDLSELGPAVRTWHTLAIPEPALRDDRMCGEVLRVDRFGNLVTNVDRRAFEQFAGRAGVKIVAGAQALTEVVATYADVAPGAVCALFGSSGHLEVAVNGGSAAARLDLARGASVTIVRA
jgi:S-adenosylmethionine hydrolase